MDAGMTHEQGHVHERAQEHAHAASPGVPRWSAVLDVGDDVGALVLYTPEELLGAEIEVSPVGEPTRRTHTQVLRRQTGTRDVCAGLYLALEAGRYRIWDDEPGRTHEVTITGGAVAEVDWR